jgi:transcription termination factor Rho
MSLDPDNNNLPSEDSSTTADSSPRKRAAKKATKKAVKKAAKKATKKRATKKVVAEKSSGAEQADMFTPGEISPQRAKTALARTPKSAGSDAGGSGAADDEVTFSSNIKVEQITEKEEPRGDSRSTQGGEPPREPKQGQQPPARQNHASKPSRPAQDGRQQEARGGEAPRNDQRPDNRKEQRPDNPQAGGPKDRGGNDFHKGNPKFNKNNKNNKRKRGKNRWQNNKGGGRRDREDDTPIELGELFDWELLDRREGLLELAKELKAGGGEPLDYSRIYNLELPELREAAAGLDLKLPHAPNRDQLINAITRHAGEQKTAIFTTGILELLDEDDGGLLVYERDSYRVKALSAYVPQVFIDYYGLQRGHIVKAQLQPHREGESCPVVVSIESVMGQDPETLSEIIPFTERVPYYPTSRILLESSFDGADGSATKWDNLSMRVVDCLTPVGFGQRGLIVAPPRTGKTVLMQGMANSIQKNYPEAHLIILLIDERPEEVTDFRRQVKGEVISSTFDESAESHVHAAEMVIEKARRMVEVGRDVVILLDSITRLARAYNTTMPNSGKILSGGVEANALQKPKRFFGSARNIEDGGSLTIIATALVETGSKMDEVIFEEFKGTGNMELHLDRGLSDKRIFPALSMDKSGTRKEELLYHPDEMLKIYSLRRAMKGLPSTDAMEMLIQRIKKTSTNAEFLMSVAR